MSKKVVREDTRAWIFAAHLYVIVVGAFVLALGSDIYRAAVAIDAVYGG